MININSKKMRFLQALLEESTISKAAARAEISRPTAYSYLEDETFQAELSKRKTECIEDCIRYLQGKLSLCNEALISIIENPKSTNTAKINAINAVFNHCKNMTETAELLEMSEKVDRLNSFVEDQECGGY